MTINVHLFGPQAELVGTRELSIDTAGDEPTVGEVLELLSSAAPELAPSLPTSRLAVNHEFADDDHRVANGDEVALIGMVSGG